MDAREESRAAALKKAGEIVRSATNNIVLARAQELAATFSSKESEGSETALLMLLTGRLAAQAAIEILTQSVVGVAIRGSDEWKALKNAGIIKERQNEIKQKLIDEFQDKKRRKIEDEERKKADEDAKRWEEWDALSEAERAARTFEFASSWKNPVQPEPTESKVSEEEKIKQKQKEEEEKKEEEEFLKNAEVTTKNKIHDEFVAEKLQDSFKFVEGTYKTWLEESNNGQMVGNEIANLSVKVIGNYSMDGNTPSALNVLHGEVIGRYSQTSVEEVASWVRSLSDV